MLLSAEKIELEIDRIIRFLRSQLDPQERAVIGVSGGLDSDVVARLVVKAISTARMKLFVVVQDNMQASHLENARMLAHDLKTNLIEIDLRGIPRLFMTRLANADPDEQFLPDGLLDPSRAKCSLRTVILSTYQDRGYVVVGTSNRTELETGFFLPFGDGLWHCGPIVHLYKSNVRLIAAQIGTHQAVLDQPASAGFWENQEDLEDLSYWLCNGGPIGQQVEFDEAAEVIVRRIHDQLSTEKVDRALYGLSEGLADNEISRESGLDEDVVSRLRLLRSRAESKKQRALGTRLENLA